MDWLSRITTGPEQCGGRPCVLGNTSSAQLQQVFLSTFADALRLLQQGEAIVEIAGI